MKTKSKAKKAEAKPKQVRPGLDGKRLYTLAQFQHDSGLGRVWVANARQNGLKVRFVGGRMFILGQHAIDWILEHGTDSRPEDTKVATEASK